MGSSSSSSNSKEEVYKDKEDVPVLVLLSDSYSKLEAISVSVNGPFFYPTLHCLLTT